MTLMYVIYDVSVSFFLAHPVYCKYMCGKIFVLLLLDRSIIRLGSAKINLYFSMLARLVKNVPPQILYVVIPQIK